MAKKIAIIFGAGPAGLTAAYELLLRSDIKPIIYESEEYVGGIAKTINYKGNRMDIGGHRFYSKSDRVMQWWFNIFPLQNAPSKDDIKLSRRIPNFLKGGTLDPEKIDKIMLIRQRISRIFFLKKFFDYPLSLTFDTLNKLGIKRIIKIIFSYIWSKVFPIRKENNLEDFFINRFGKELYLTFFKDYTQKVLCIPCTEVSAEWGHVRAKGLSVTKLIAHALRKFVSLSDSSPEQKQVETSLIEQFIYPKLGPGQFWEEIARIIIEKGGEIHIKHKVVGLDFHDNAISKATIKNEAQGDTFSVSGDFFLSTIPLKELVNFFGENVPVNVQRVADGLSYRDFITVGLLLRKLKMRNETNIKSVNNIIPDTWIYIQEKDVKLGRVQIFNNWSPYLVKDENTVWLGLEYFCSEGDELWSMDDSLLKDFAVNELNKIGFIEKRELLDSVVIRTLKTYPVLSGTYKEVGVLQEFLSKYENLFLFGRNGMHKYNSMDHSILTAMTAVDNIINGVITKDNIWAIDIVRD